MNNDDDAWGMNTTLATKLPQRAPTAGELVQVRSRRWLVEEVVPPETAGESSLIRLACADDDAQGQSLSVFWDYELDRLILEDEGWTDLAAKGFDSPRQFAAFLHTLRWHCVTATDPQPLPGAVPGRNPHRRLPDGAAAQGPSAAAGQSLHCR